jgi:hypothetical protein
MPTKHKIQSAHRLASDKELKFKGLQTRGSERMRQRQQRYRRRAPQDRILRGLYWQSRLQGRSPVGPCSSLARPRLPISILRDPAPAGCGRQHCTTSRFPPGGRAPRRLAILKLSPIIIRLLTDFFPLCLSLQSLNLSRATAATHHFSIQISAKRLVDLRKFEVYKPSELVLMKRGGTKNPVVSA